MKLNISKEQCIAMAESEAQYRDPDCSVPVKAAPIEDQIKRMVDRFLGWKLPRDTFNPDCGISFDKKPYNAHTPHPALYEPTGTNLFDATQADAMVRHIAKEFIEEMLAQYDRTSRNRDMWRGQVDRQAEKLTIFRAALAMVDEWHQAGENSLELIKVMTIVEWALSQDAALSPS